jgi:hypothetical protein
VLWASLSFTALSLDQQPGGACRSRRLRDFVAGTLALGIISSGRGLWLGLVAAVGLATAVRSAELAAPFELRGEGSFPLQYIESLSGASRQHTLTAAPYVGLTARAYLQPDLTTSIYTEGGHERLGSFRDTDNTFASIGGNLVKHWGTISAGMAIERTHYFDGVFGATANIANDVVLFARHVWRPNQEFRLISAVNATIRMDEGLAVQRYTYSARFDIERRLLGSWWALAAMRIRYADYVGGLPGGHDTRLAFVGGLKYEFNDSVSARLLAGYENRTSNIASRNTDKYSIGASLDFNVDFLRPERPGR